MALNGVVTIAVVLSLAFAAAVLWYTVKALKELEAMPTRRQVERTIIPADWDRIMAMITLKKEVNANEREN